MDFIDQVKAISQQIQRLKQSVQTEEATKNAFVLPLINALGYNVFDTTEVCPEYIAAAPGLKGEKVDYAILVDSTPSILIECKCWAEDLENPKHSSQLYKYFNATQAKFSVLTNGILYRFYTDIDKNNIMDDKPFFEFNMLDFGESSVNELKKFSKAIFNPNEMENVARNLLYTKEIKRLLAEQLTNPSPEFVKFFASQVYSGKMTASVVEKFTDLVKQSLKEYINDRITDKIKSAIDLPDTTPVETLNAEVKEINLPSEVLDDDIVTTQEELEGFYIIKSILREVVDICRIKYRDTKNYFGINIDGSVKKTVCRLWLNSEKKYIGVFDVDNKEVKKQILSLDEVYGLANLLKDRAKFLAKDSKIQTQVIEQ